MDESGVTPRKARSKVVREMPRACACGQSRCTKTSKEALAGVACALLRAWAPDALIEPVVWASAGARLIRAEAAMTDRRMDTPGECWMETSSQRPNKINQGLRERQRGGVRAYQRRYGAADGAIATCGGETCS